MGGHIHHQRLQRSYQQSQMLSKVRLHYFQSQHILKRRVEQANTLFSSILHSEVTPPSARPSSPIRSSTAGPSSSAGGSGATAVAPSTPTRKRLLTFNSPSSSNPSTPNRRLDTTTDEVYSLSPVRAQSRSLLESPRRSVRHVCKTPYRVLDAPDLADDFYLNLVDWSSTNLLGVGLGNCGYLWAANTATVNKLCDLSSQNDTVSSVSWAQKVSYSTILESEFILG